MVRTKLGTIKELAVDPSWSYEELNKRARKLAMTGGFELALPEGIGESGLLKLIDTYLPELLCYDPGQLTYKSNNAFRVLELVIAHAEMPESKRAELTEALSASG